MPQCSLPRSCQGGNFPKVTHVEGKGRDLTSTRPRATENAVTPSSAAPSRFRADHARLTITDPRDGSTVGSLATDGADQVRAVVTRAAATLLDEHAEELADLEQRENGRLRGASLGGIRAAVDTLRQYAELGPLHRGRSLRGALGSIDLTRAEPRGIAAVITPWNDPIAVTAGLIGAALVTGNVVISKPSERCPHLGLRLVEILSDCFPLHVLQVLTGAGEVGETLITAPGVEIVAHVGSTAAGERIARVTALTGAHLIRENGGNDALVVDADVDPRWAASQAAIGAFTNSGQICTAVERIFVHRDLADEFLTALTAEARKRNEEGALAPLVDERMRAEVQEQVRASANEGARILEGGDIPDGPGAHYPATVLTGLHPSMPLFSEETFGPVAPVMVVDSFEEALRRAADDSYGLQATVLTDSMANAALAVDALPVGTVKVNAVFGGAPGGSAEPRGRSGSGFGYGPELLDEMTTVKVVHVESAVRR
ncbi:aldehyde dehydrogenase [Pseudoclavibacter sp. AY1F1]|nr:aldehyde dehydrogenase [Pseudoclavibacter sp. AY1F1]